MLFGHVDVDVLAVLHCRRDAFVELRCLCVRMVSLEPSRAACFNFHLRRLALAVESV